MQNIKNWLFALIVGVLIIVIGILVFLILSKGTKTIKISFDTQMETKVEAIKIKEGETFIFPTVKRDGYDFKGWYLNNQLVNEKYKFTKDVTLVAKWEIKSFTVTFNSDGGSNVSSINVKYNEKLTLPDNPTKSGYTFVSWQDASGKEYKGGEILSSDIGLIAIWKANSSSGSNKTPTPTPVPTSTFTIKFNSAGGSSCSDIKVTCGKALPTLPTPIRSGVNFIGWFNSSGQQVRAGQKLECKDITLTAKYTTVTIKNTPTAIPKATTSPKTTTSPVTPTPRIKVTPTPKVSVTSTPIPSGNKTMTIIFNSNGGSSISPMTVNCGEKKLNLPKPTKSGYAFMYWSDITNNRPINVGSILTECKNITVQANWYAIPTNPQ